MDQNEDEAAVTLTSLVDIVDEEEQLIEDANAVLGGSDDKNCTYLMGYVDRQALYSCRTCSVSCSGEPAGVCLACGLECHDGHDLVELYTKRNFRCDCGNGKFMSEFKCKLCPDKVSKNEDNHYNQNYLGLYCTCSKPYPDPNDSIEDMMIQCVICEDWFHGRHVSNVSLDDENFEEMTCSTCMKACSFLWPYVRLCKAIHEKSSVGKDQVDGVIVEVEDVKNDLEKKKDHLPQDSCFVASTSEMHVVNTCDEKQLVLDLPSSVEVKINSEKDLLCQAEPATAGQDVQAEPIAGSSAEELPMGCLLSQLSGEHNENWTGSVFWPSSWRKKLCSCPECLILYEKLNVSYLLEDGDTIAAYEHRGKSKTTLTPTEQAMSGLNHVQKVELLQGYNDLKSGLTDYLRKFAENGKVVRQEDVEEFFNELKARKRQRPDDSSQYFCK